MLTYYSTIPLWRGTKGEEKNKLTNFRDRITAYIKNIFDRKLAADGSLDRDTYLYNVNQLIKGIEEGFEVNFGTYRDGRTDLMQRMRRNTYTFVAFKAHSNIAQIVNELKDPKGKLRTWSKFKKAALKIDKDYNVNWLKTEYNTTITSAQMANKWHNINKHKDVLPWLEYKTQEDDRVRHSHELLNGTIKKVDDPFWDTYYPPNGWGCRCYVLQHAEATETNSQGYPDEKQMPPAFRTNPGKTGTVFSQDHPYFKFVEDDPRKRVKIYRSMIDILQDEEVYDRIWKNEHSGHTIQAHITHLGNELTQNTKLAKLLTSKHDVKLLPVAFTKGVKYPDMLIDGNTVVEYKQIKTTSISNAKRNAVKKAVIQYRNSKLKNKDFAIAIEADNMTNKDIRNLINRSFASWSDISYFIIKRGDKLHYAYRTKK